jgi:hypothetical protein
VLHRSDVRVDDGAIRVPIELDPVVLELSLKTRQTIAVDDVPEGGFDELRLVPSVQFSLPLHSLLVILELMRGLTVPVQCPVLEPYVSFREVEVGTVLRVGRVCQIVGKASLVLRVNTVEEEKVGDHPLPKALH